MEANNTNTPTETIKNVRAMLSRRASRMNGLEVIEAYKALHPTSGALDITFPDMYKALVAIATGAPAVNVRFSVNRA